MSALRSSTDDDPGPLTAIIVREAGRWSQTPLNDQQILALTSDKVLALASDDGPTGATTLEAGARLDPVEPLVIGVTGSGLVLVPPGDDAPVPLPRRCVRLLDAIAGPTTIEVLAAQTGMALEDAALAAGALVELGAATHGTQHVPQDRSVDDMDRGDDPERWRPQDPSIPDWGDVEPDETARPAGVGPLRKLDGERIPVVAVHLPRFGPPLALGMIMAHARTWQGGMLAERYELRPIITVDEARVLLADHVGPGVVLLSNYVWSHEENLRLAADLAAANPELVFIHGGPHTPKYDQDLEAFFERPGVDLAVLGEGEVTCAEALRALLQADRWGDLTPLLDVPGLVLRDPTTAALTKTEPRERLADLDALPSPYLTGEFDDIHPASWSKRLGTVVVTETNRGCPYKCAFCDWGSATMSRIRKFSMDRVLAELDWLADRGLEVWMVSDANFGILPRDVDIAQHIVGLRRRTGVPYVWGVNTAKNSTRNLSKIISMLCEANVTVVSSLALQTRDPDTLATIDRSNISSDRYDDLALTFRHERLPILCDLILGLPGATLTSFKADLQWCFDHEITPRVWVCQVLPNAPMNAPEYRAEHELVLDDRDVVIASRTFTKADRAVMMDLRMAERSFEHLGLARHLLRYLQWDCGRPALDVLEVMVRTLRAQPERYPLLAWTINHLDGFFAPPLGWAPFYRELKRFVLDELGVEPSSALDTVLAVQQFLMPDRNRSYPATISLAHDYLAYYRSATASLHETGRPSAPEAPLSTFGPGAFTVVGDPAGLGSSFERLFEERPPDLLPGRFWHISHLELDSPLTRWVNEVSATPGYTMRAVTEESRSVPVPLVARATAPAS